MISLSAARALRKPLDPGKYLQSFLLEALELRQEAVSVGYLLRFPGLEHGGRQVPCWCRYTEGGLAVKRSATAR